MHPSIDGEKCHLRPSHVVGALVVGEFVVGSSFGLADGEGVGFFDGDKDGSGVGCS